MTKNCDRCGKELKEGEKVFGITTGIIDSEYDGFVADDLAWRELLCASCAERLLTIIGGKNDKTN